MQNRDDIIDYLTIKSTGINNESAIHLLSVYGSAKEVLQASYKSLTQEAELNGRLADRLILSRNMDKVAAEMTFIEKYNIRVLCYDCPDYPKSLMFCSDAPFVLYCKGDIDLNAGNEHYVSIVGTRRMSDFSMVNCDMIVSRLAEFYPNTVVVSGLAHGIDSIAHTSALKYGLKTIAVVAHGLDTIYPQDNRPLAESIIRNSGAIITEYPFGTNSLQRYFLERNRIVAGLSVATIMVESPIKGGSLVTADIADSYGREVFTFPARLTDKSCGGNLKLLKNNKANLLIDIDDMEYVLGWERDKKRDSKLFEVHLTDEEQQVYDLFDKYDHISVDHIVELCHFGISRANSILTDMEINGIIKSVLGRMFIKLR